MTYFNNCFNFRCSAFFVRPRHRSEFSCIWFCFLFQASAFYKEVTFYGHLPNSLYELFQTQKEKKFPILVTAFFLLLFFTVVFHFCFSCDIIVEASTDICSAEVTWPPIFVSYLLGLCHYVAHSTGMAYDSLIQICQSSFQRDICEE